VLRFFICIVGFVGAASAFARDPARSVMVPLVVESGRPYVELTLTGAHGLTRKARFLVDTGGGGFLLSEKLATELRLTYGEISEEDGQKFALIATPLRVSVNDFELKLNPQRTLMQIGAALPYQADGMLPGHVLSSYHVIFDYPKQTFTLAIAGELKPTGTSIPMPTHKRSGFPRTEISVDGETYGFLLDTGASFTMVSEALLKKWGTQNPKWSRYTGAHGDAKTLGGMTLETMYVPNAKWSTFVLTEFGVTSQREGTFERWMSGMTAAPIVGALAGNVLTKFRIELDYANEKLYISRPETASRP
jgi:predicted aspartyl protease